MQSFVRKLVTPRPRICYGLHRLFHTRPHNAFSSLPKPSQPQHFHRISTSSFLTRPLFHSPSRPSRRTLSPGIPGSLSDPVIARYHLASNSRNAFPRISTGTRSLLDCRAKLLRAQFHRQSFGFNQSSHFYRGGWRSWFRRLTTSDVVLGLIIANATVFISWRILDEKFMIKNFTISLDNFKSGRFHTMITNAFSHIETEHIISNMIGLYFFGMNIGRAFGPEFLLKLYLAGAVGGSVFYLVHQAYKAQKSKGWGVVNPSKELALGASGAVNAIMLLDIFLFPKATLYLDFFIPVPAVLLGIFLIGKDMLRIIEGDSRISGSAHLGGAAVAAMAWARVRKGRF